MSAFPVLTRIASFTPVNSGPIAIDAEKLSEPSASKLVNRPRSPLALTDPGHRAYNLCLSGRARDVATFALHDVDRVPGIPAIRESFGLNEHEAELLRDEALEVCRRSRPQRERILQQFPAEKLTANPSLSREWHEGVVRAGVSERSRRGLLFGLWTWAARWAHRHGTEILVTIVSLCSLITLLVAVLEVR